MEKILSIAIPLYNCEDSIGTNLEKILLQLGNREDVEILVCDNASTDNSYEIVKMIERKDKRIKSLKNERNIGVSGNTYKVINAARGAFVHLMSADDFYEDGGLQKLLHVIEEHPEIEIIALSNNYLNVFDGNKIYIPERISGGLCTTGDDFLKREELRCLCLSNVVIRKSELQKVKKWDAESLWPHLYVLSEIIEPDTRGYVFSYRDPLISVQYGNQAWVERDPAVIYYSAILLYEKMSDKCGANGENIKQMLKEVISPANQKSRNFLTNVTTTKNFFGLYKTYFGGNWFWEWCVFSGKLLLYPKKDFFSNLKE